MSEHMTSTLDLEAGADTVDLETVDTENVDESSAEKISPLAAVAAVAACEESSVREPYVGMEFESEDDAKYFYGEYARREGFSMRLDRCHRSDVDNRITSRRLSCNKQGFNMRGKNENKPLKKPRVSIREGCEAMLWVKENKSGKWVVTKFIKEHNHPLIGSAGASPSYRLMEAKDRKIHQLTKELERRDQQCQQYRRLLLSLLETVDDQAEFFSGKVEHIVKNVKQLENEVQKPLDSLAFQPGC
ncbi:hypothetical protein RIF29_00500 [Crotalaria pallida]|uniref:FAR1 domain-containing protein n=1 Tax=Crotalaria pallida TaxID=3830 RepID=A0AAN9IVT0_CROPI